MDEAAPKMLTIEQVARLFGVHQSTIRNWADDGRLPVIRLPSGHRRFDAREIDRVRREVGMMQTQAPPLVTKP